MTMRLLKEVRRGFAVYWPPTGTDEFSNPTFGTAVELMVRWVDTQQLFINKQGEQQLSKSIVMTGIDLLVGGVLFRGRLTDLTDATKPFKNRGATQISQFTNVPTIRYDDNVRAAWL